jgi:hypothetical protein
LTEVRSVSRVRICWSPVGRVALGEGQLEHGVAAGADCPDRLLRVLALEAPGELVPELQVGVIERVVPEETLPRVLTEGHPVETLQIGLAPDVPALAPLPDRGHQPLVAVTGVGVGRQPAGHPTRFRLLREPVQHPERLGALRGVVVESDRVAEPERVRLVLVVTAELEKEQPQAQLREVSIAPQLGNRNHPDAHPQRHELLAAHLRGAVPSGHVSHLVAHHHGELGLGVEVGEDAPGHVDEASGEGEGVHRRIVDEAEGPGQLGPFCALGDGVAELSDIVLQSGVVVDTERRHRVLILLLAKGNLLPFAHEHELLLPGGRVGGAGKDGGEHEDGAAAENPGMAHVTPSGIGQC